MLIKLVAFNGRYIHSCLSLFYLRQELGKNLPECEAQMCQLTINDPYYATLTGIAAGGPAYLFLSVYVWSGEYVARLVVDLARVMPEMKIVLGGPQALIMAEMGLPANCTVFKGEIEGAPAEFYQDLRRGQLAPAYQADANPPFSSPYREDDFNGELKHRHIYYESSRGCPFSCSYCLSALEHGVRHKDLAAVKEELQLILPAGPKIIKFVDRTFNDRPERALVLWRFLAGQPGKTVFHFEIAPDRFTQEMLDFLATVPVDRFQFEIGIQSTNPETLAAVNRKINPAGIGENIRRLVSFDNIHLHLDLILGLPYETAATFRQSFNDVCAWRPHYIQMGLLKVLPGTAIGREPGFGLVHCARPPYDVLATKWLDQQTLRQLYLVGECVEAFYNTRFFKTFLAHVLARQAEADSFAFFEELTNHCLQQGFFERAHTQEVMSLMLHELSANRPDYELLQEFLVFDWLRCGHRFLPAHLQHDSFKQIKDHLWEQLPQNFEPLYSHQTRNDFFKRSLFYRFSAPLLAEVGLYNELDGEGYVAFLPEQTAGVLKWNKVVVVK
ncbi:MAG: DUF4080 domain-containing protein [Proteobacteria bacterium]|nr:DUF4080 domain-containing protein [Pseudomonadota bacterium]MBU1715490.1 DUF4080 domain-containing protein [Pseudomonadota bacterium]